MNIIGDNMEGAIGLIVSGNDDFRRVVLLTFRVSGTATLLATVVGVPVGIVLGRRRFIGQKLILSVWNALLGLPPVVVGLWLTMLFWRTGPLGFLNILYTPKAMVIAQFCIALPEVVVFTAVTFSTIPDNFFRQVKALGASTLQTFMLLFREVRLGMLSAIIAGFGAAVSEVGASLMLGGNIYRETRVMTTTILLEVERGNFTLAIALSMLLMFLSFVVVAVLTYWQRRGY